MNDRNRDNDPHRFLGADRTEVARVAKELDQQRRYHAHLRDLEAKLDDIRGRQAALVAIPEPVALPVGRLRVLAVLLAAVAPALALGVLYGPNHGIGAWVGAAATFGLLDLVSAGAVEAERGLGARGPSPIPAAFTVLIAAGLGAALAALGPSLLSPAPVVGGALAFALPTMALVVVFHRVRAAAYDRAHLVTLHSQLHDDARRVVEAIGRIEHRADSVYYALAARAAETLRAFDATHSPGVLH